MKVIMEGFNIKQIKQMIEHHYGACIWEKLESGEIICFPTSHGSVHILSVAARLGVEADIFEKTHEAT